MKYYAFIFFSSKYFYAYIIMLNLVILMFYLFYREIFEKIHIINFNLDRELNDFLDNKKFLTSLEGSNIIMYKIEKY